MKYQQYPNALVWLLTSDYQREHTDSLYNKIKGHYKIGSHLFFGQYRKNPRLKNSGSIVET